MRGTANPESMGSKPIPILIEKKRKKKEMEMALKKEKKYTVVNVRCKKNNTHLIAVDIFGKTIVKKSEGKKKIKGNVKKNGLIAREMGKELIEKGHQQVEVRIKGYGRGRSGIERGMRGVGLKIVRIGQRTMQAHNGCRAKKQKRL